MLASAIPKVVPTPTALQKARRSNRPFPSFDCEGCIVAPLRSVFSLSFTLKARALYSYLSASRSSDFQSRAILSLRSAAARQTLETSAKEPTANLSSNAQTNPAGGGKHLTL
jgi:hypothetical protein